MWYVYICNKSNKLYTGITTDITNRMKQHKNPQLIHIEEYQDKYKAVEREKQIKSWSRQKKLHIANLKRDCTERNRSVSLPRR